MKTGSNIWDATYNDIVKRYRNYLRKYSYDSVIRTTSSFLRNPPNSAELPTFPWVSERFLFWTLSDKESFYATKYLDEKTLIELNKACFSDADTIYEMVEAPTSNPQLFFRQLIIQQVEYQRPFDIFSFARQILVLKKFSSTSKLILNLKNDLNSSPTDYLNQCFHISQVTESNISLENSIHTITRRYGRENASIFLNNFSTPIETVRSTIKEKRGVKSAFEEWHRPSLLHTFPCIQINDRYVLSGKAAYRRYCEHFIDDWIDKNNDTTIRQDWDNALCKYTEEILRLTNSFILTENEIRKRYSVSGKVCDLCVLTDQLIVLIEVKRKNFSATTPILANENNIKSKLKMTAVKATNQLFNTYKHITSSGDIEGRIIINLVITSSQLWFGNIDFLCSTQEEVPPNLYMMSISEIDQLCSLVSDKKCTFKDFFHELIERNNEPSTALYSPELLLKSEKFKNLVIPQRIKSATLGL